jgi:hypothetical protein
MLLNSEEIIVQANPVKYHDIDYHDGYIVVTQNRTRRKIPKGYFFEDNGSYIYISTWYSFMFQHKQKTRSFILNKETKEFRDYEHIKITKHQPEKVEPKQSNTIERLKK